MKQFFKFFFASMLGFVVGMFVFFFLLIAIVGGIMSTVTKPESTTVKANSVLTLDLSYDIKEKTENNPFKEFRMGNFEPKVYLGLNDILKNIEKAKNDANIKGIFLNFGYFGSGAATAEQIRESLLDFKKSGKFIFAYAEVYTQKGYYVASVADKIYVNPRGLFEFRGLYANITFYKNLLDKLGVEPQIFFCGKYKSATEPFRFDKMSEPNREMMLSLIGDIQNNYLKNISASRNIPVEKLKDISDNLLIQMPTDAKKYGLVDDVCYQDKVYGFIKDKLGLKDKDRIELVDANKYDHTPDNKTKSFDDPQIAILYAQGEIVDGKGKDDQIGSESLVKQIVKVRDNEKIKAVVFRVNSPGGSALASDIIWREINLLKEKKPVIVSMGDYAASGGYYISCNATKIVAMPNTLTGSIGVFGILPNIQKLMNEKLGITFDGVGTGKYSDLGTVTRPMREDEKFIVQRGVDSIYLDFRTCVSQGRHIPLDSVEDIAQGRVWTGNQGLKIGLVDTIGDLNTAIWIAAKSAKVTKYRTVEYPQEKENNFSKILSAISENDDDDVMMKSKLGVLYSYYKQVQTLSTMKGVQAKVPYTIDIQ